MKNVFKSSMIFLSITMVFLVFPARTWAEPAGEDELSEELLSEEDSQEEIEALIEQYLGEMEQETLPGGKQEVEKVDHPEMVIEWDSEGKMINRFPNQGYFTMNVPNGMLCSQPVELSLSSGCMAIIEHDGLSRTLTSSRRFTEAGNYHIRILSYQAPEEALQSEDYALYETSRYFTILAETTSIGAVPAPEGFDIVHVIQEGRELTVENPRCFFLTGDGQYTIQYAAGENSAGQHPDPPHLESTWIQDSTAPFLSFSKELEDGEIASGMLEFYPSEENCRIYMTYNGEQGWAVSNQLTVAGYYRLEIEDAAGNSREYHLRIRPDYQFFDARVIIAGVILIFVIILWMLLQRRNMQVL